MSRLKQLRKTPLFEMSWGLLSPQARQKFRRFVFLRGVLGVLELAAIAALGLIASVGSDLVSGRNRPTQLKVTWFADWDLGVQISLFAAFAITLFVSKSVLAIWLTRGLFRFLAEEEVGIGDRITSKVLNLSIQDLRHHGSSKVTYALTHGINSMTSRYLGYLGVAVSEIMLIVLLTVACFLVSPTVSLLAIICLSGSLGLIQSLISQRLFRSGVDYAASTVEAGTRVRETLDTYRELKSQNKLESMVDQIGDQRWISATRSANLNYLATMPRYLLELTVILTGAVIGVFQSFFSSGSDSIETVSLFLVIGSRLVPSLLSLQGAVSSMRQCEAETQGLLDLVSLDSLLSDPNGTSSPTRIPVSRSELMQEGVRVELESITVRYTGNASPALEDVTFSIESGTLVAIVGRSGAGKSTLADVILGIIEPSSGNLLLNGIGRSDFTEQFPTAVAYVPQNPSIIRGSIRSNVALGVPENEIDDERVKTSIAFAQLSEFVSSLPEELETSIGEVGSTLSGGQRQRLGIARALYAQPRLLVLDEPTSALDSATELELTHTLSQLRGHMTVVVIAHRLTTVRDADQLIVIEEGRNRYDISSIAQLEEFYQGLDSRLDSPERIE